MSRLLQLFLVLAFSMAHPYHSHAQVESVSLLKKFEDSGETRARVPLLVGLSEECLKRYVPSVVRYARESLRLSEDIGDALLTSLSLEALGKALYLSGELNEAVECQAGFL